MEAAAAAAAANAHARVDRTRAKLALLEARAGALDALAGLPPASDGDFGGDGDGGDFLIPTARGPPSPGAPAAELRLLLQAVADADAAGGGALAALTQRHAVMFATRIVEDAAPPPLGRAARNLLEVAAAALCALSQRPAAHAALLDAGSVPALISLLSPAAPRAAAADAASALGNAAAHTGCRRALRAHGGVGALVALLQPGGAPLLQAAAAGALCLVAAHDAVIQDSVRYLGGIDALVELLASDRPALSEVARYCLAALRRGNARNAADILQAVRASRPLARDFARLRDALELLDGDDDSGERARERSITPAGAGAVGALVAAQRAVAADEEEREARRCRAALGVLRASADALDAQLVRASADAARTCARVTRAGRVRPFSAAAAAGSAATAAAAAVSAAAAAASAAAAAERGGALEGVAAAVARAASPARRPARSPLGKHILHFTSDEVRRAGQHGVGCLHATVYLPRLSARPICLAVAAATAAHPSPNNNGSCPATINLARDPEPTPPQAQPAAPAPAGPALHARSSATCSWTWAGSPLTSEASAAAQPPARSCAWSSRPRLRPTPPVPTWRCSCACRATRRAASGG
jgi:hypothetical protein